MNRVESKPAPIELVPQALVPFYLISRRERQVLQLLADGLTNRQTANTIGISPKTVAIFRYKIGNIGTSHRATPRYEKNNLRTVALALIQDGIENGYLKHHLDDTQIKSLTRKEDAILEAVSQGQGESEIAERQIISIKTVETHIMHVLEKLGARNSYHAVARRTYLKSHGQWKIVDNRGKTSH